MGTTSHASIQRKFLKKLRNMKNYFLFSFRTVILSLITVLSGSMFFAQNITIDGKTDDWAAALNGNPIKVFVRDANDTNDDQFTQGSQDPDPISAWGWVNGNTNDKGDISNAAAVLIGNRIYFSGDRTAINGSAQIGFWFFTNGTKKNANGTFSPQHSVGDLLVLSNFTNGGGAVQLRIYKWVGSGGSDGSLNLIATNTNAFVNNSYQPTPVYPGWTYQGKNVPSVGTPAPNTYATGSFFEGYVDISPGSEISPCFSSFILETRNSASVTASLQDFVGGLFNVKPLAPSVTPGKNCGPGNVTVSASCVAGTQVRWYAQADAATPLSTGGNITIDGNSLTANLTATTTFYAACYNTATGCESERTPVVATINSTPIITVEYTPIKCNGGQSTVTVSATGGAGPYTGTGTFTVGAGTHNYTVSNASGCTDSKEIMISEPDKLVIKVEYTPIKCNGDQSTVTVSATGGTAPYTGTGTFTVAAGTHNYTVSDANGCSDSKEIMISEPDKLVIKVEYTPVKCNGDQSTVTVSATGGTAPYTGTGTFTVGAGTHNYTVTDANGCTDSKQIMISEPDKLVIKVEYTPLLCNGGKSTVTVSATGGTAPYSGTGTFIVGAGIHNYTVSDANGCSDSQSITITQPDPLKVVLSAPPITCSTETVMVTASVSGGTAPYSYLWSNGSMEATAYLGVGAYSVTVTDANGCKATASGEIKPPSCGNFTTVTQGGWGAKASGNNWGKYRDNNFAGAFPTGLAVGAGSRILKLTSAKAVEDFLPSGSTPRALEPGTMTNPGESYSNVLAGQTVALTLNVTFDLYDTNFSASTSHLGDLIVISGTFANWTVNQVLAEANRILGGEPSLYSASEINAIVDAINNNYDGGKMNNGQLTCPCPGAVAAPAKGPDNSAVTEAKAPVPEVSSAIVLYPNPSNGEFNIKFEAEAGTKVLVQLYDMAGKLVGDYSSKVVRNGKNASLNVSNYSLAGGLYLVKVKTSQQEKTIKLIIKK